VRHGGQPAYELRRLDETRQPTFLAYTTSGDDLLWAESAVDTDGLARTSIWRGSWRTAAAPVTLVADAGGAVFGGSQYDLQVTAGRLWWAAAATTGDQFGTELRSVPLGGGDVTIRPIDTASPAALRRPPR
jgi:hypothetical protein